jgi:hypothetical protein
MVNFEAQAMPEVQRSEKPIFRENSGECASLSTYRSTN